MTIPARALEIEGFWNLHSLPEVGEEHVFPPYCNKHKCLTTSYVLGNEVHHICFGKQVSCPEDLDTLGPAYAQKTHFVVFEADDVTDPLGINPVPGYSFTELDTDSYLPARQLHIPFDQVVQDSWTDFVIWYRNGWAAELASRDEKR